MFTDLSPTIKQITYGTTHCIVWQLAAPSPYRNEVACYLQGVVQAKKVDAGAPGTTLIGSYPLLDGSGVIGWIVKPTGEATIVFSGKCGSTCGGASNLPNETSFSWTFPTSP